MLHYQKCFKFYLINDKAVINRFNGSNLRCRISIPQFIEGHPVVAIDDDFSGLKSASGFTLPDGLEAIGKMAFSRCNNVTKFKMPNSLKFIGTCAFYDCNALTKVALNEGLRQIGHYAFSLARFENINIPEGVTEIGVGAFALCDSLKSIIIPSSITNVSNYMFQQCAALTDVHLPDTLTSIGNYAFYGCKSLIDVAIPDSVSSIGDYAFAGCNLIKSITLPDSLTEFGANVFSGCSKLSYNKYDNAYYLGSKTNPFMVLIKSRGRKITTCNVHPDTKFIASNAFKKCTLLEKITIPGKLLGIDASAFEECNALTDFSFLDNIPITNSFPEIQILSPFGKRTLWRDPPNDKYSVYDLIKNSL